MIRLRSRLFWILCGLVFAVQARADLATEVPDDWFTRPPTPDRIKVVQAAAVRGWVPLAVRLYQGSLRAYELKQEDAAAGWYYIGRWCELLGRSQKKSSMNWLETVSSSGEALSEVNQAKIYALPDAPMSLLVTEKTVTWLLNDREFSESFFNLLSNYDLPVGALGVLQALIDSNPTKVSNYRQLALALALVYDTPPSKSWPHWQVSPEALPRQLPSAVDAFRFFTDADLAGRTLYKLSTLSARELKFLVDLSAPFQELIWAQQSVKFPLTDLVKSYEAVRYRQDRIDSQEYQWPGKKYDLRAIYLEGGICVDQAYFATQSSKARGVPALLFSGSGKDGRHAWFGYLGPGKKWILDAGRYAEQRYVTGVAIDPQTWLKMSDHQLSFLSEGFHRLPSFRQSQQHLVFADIYMKLGDKAAAAIAARKAVNYERRNSDAWDMLLAANEDAPAAVREGLLREAAMAVQRYPDLNSYYTRALAASLRARGEVTVAEFEERSLVRRGQSNGRTDMAVRYAMDLMKAAAPAEQVRVYKQVLQQYGTGAGISFYDRVAEPLIDQMIVQNRRSEAMQVIMLTRSVLKPEAGSQFDTELTEMAAKANAK
jgi:hypothetical protein